MTSRHRRRPSLMISKRGSHLRQIPQPAETGDAGLSRALPLVGRCVTLRETIRACESYAQPGMRARVRKVRGCGLNGAISVTLDFTEFEPFNKPFEASAWLDQHLVVQLTAREAGAYVPIEDYFLMGVDQAREAMIPLDDRVSSALQARFQDSGRDAGEYIAWLEEQLAEANPGLIEDSTPGTGEPF